MSATALGLGESPDAYLSKKEMDRSNVEAPRRQELCGKFEDPLRCTSSQSPSEMVIDGRSTGGAVGTVGRRSAARSLI
jgi:hypothetical protein